MEDKMITNLDKELDEKTKELEALDQDLLSMEELS
jgi:hypothetical protein